MTARLLLRLDRFGRVTVAPCQNRETRERWGVERERCARAAWAVDSDGRNYRGAGAINAALAGALVTPVPLQLYRLPLVGWIEDRVYEIVAALRGYLPGVEAYCMRFPEDCGDSPSDAGAGPAEM